MNTEQKKAVLETMGWEFRRVGPYTEASHPRSKGSFMSIGRPPSADNNFHRGWEPLKCVCPVIPPLEWGKKCYCGHTPEDESDIEALSFIINCIFQHELLAALGYARGRYDRTFKVRNPRDETILAKLGEG